MKVTVRQISVDSKPESRLFLKLEWDRDLGAGFVVVLCDGVSAWSGEVSEEDVTREAREMEMERKRYVQDLQLVLTGENQTTQNYRFCLTPERPGTPVLQLSYEKMENDISFRLGMVDLLPVPESTEVIRELISFGLQRNASLKTKNQNLLEENRRIRDELEHITAQMEGCVREKEEVERDLFSRFVLVLNEKKNKLRDLQQRIKQLEVTVEEEKQRYTARQSSTVTNHNRPSQNPHIYFLKLFSSFRRKRGVAGDEREQAVKLGGESDYGSTTDEEQQEDPENSALKTPDQEALPGNPMNDSLHDITDVAPSRKRRQRHLQQPPTQSKRPALEPSQNSRAELTKGHKGEVLAGVGAPVVSPNPDDLFEDI
ncbi:DNA repair protein XRCC4 isoform X1 [Astyanax mexicanus]|uniref:DNA repair protein XRCC4 isoform X1 n=1 Tax=Astyanax mexicanus TaxID=7994 RepID=UPI0020CAEBDD|nr:DNA repair protein XRCC4 isoform X1 [Astyanax mexicanus]